MKTKTFYLVFLLTVALLGCAKPAVELSSREDLNVENENFFIDEQQLHLLPKEIKPPKSLGGTLPPPALSKYMKENNNWFVVLVVNIDNKGSAVGAECVSEKSEMGDLYAQWAKSWRFRPATKNGKQISSVYQFTVPKNKTSVTYSLSTTTRH